METFYNILLYGGIIAAVIFAAVAVFLFIKLDIPKVIGDITGANARKQIEEIREKGYEGAKGAQVSKKDAIKAKTESGRISVRETKSESAPKPSNQTGTRPSGSTTSNVQKQAVRKQPIQSSQPKPVSQSVEEEGTELLGTTKPAKQASYKKAVEETQHTVSMSDVDGILDDLYGDDEGATDVLSAADNEETDVLAGYDLEDEESTDVLTSDDSEATDVLAGYDLDDEESTDVLTSDDSEATDVLAGYDLDDEESTDVLTSDDYEATDVLTGYDLDDEGATDVLTNEEVSYKTSVKKLVDIIVVHTEETV